MPSARFIVCEECNRWVVALRWALSGTSIPVHEASGWHACRRELATGPGSVVGLELREDNLEATVERLLELRSTLPQVHVVVLARRDLQAAFSLMYEAGAVYVVESTRNLTAVARLVQRLLESAPTVPVDYRQAVLERLPW